MRLLFRTQVADVDKFAYRVESLSGYATVLVHAVSCMLCCAVLQLSTADAEEVAEHESENIKRVARLMKVRWPPSAITSRAPPTARNVAFSSVHQPSVRTVPRFVRLVDCSRATSDCQLRSTCTRRL